MFSYNFYKEHSAWNDNNFLFPWFEMLFWHNYVNCEVCNCSVLCHLASQLRHCLSWRRHPTVLPNHCIFMWATTALYLLTIIELHVQWSFLYWSALWESSYILRRLSLFSSSWVWPSLHSFVVSESDCISLYLIPTFHMICGYCTRTGSSTSVLAGKGFVAGLELFSERFHVCSLKMHGVSTK